MKTSKNKFAASHKEIMRKDTHRLRNSISSPTGNDGTVLDRGILSSDVFEWEESDLMNIRANFKEKVHIRDRTRA
jgi:urease accessory protein UreE